MPCARNVMSWVHALRKECHVSPPPAYVHIYTYIHICIYTYVYLTHGQTFFSFRLHLSVFPATTGYPCRHRGCPPCYPFRPPCYAFRFLFASPSDAACHRYRLSLFASFAMSNLAWLHLLPVFSWPGDFGASHLDRRCRPSGAYVLHA